MRALAVASIFVVALLASAGVQAQSVAAPTLDPPTLTARLQTISARNVGNMPHDVATLDQMVREKRFTDLVARLKASDAPANIMAYMNWEQREIFDGGPFIIGYAYMMDLWRAGVAKGEQDDQGLKGSAVTYFLYSYVLIRLDGLKCADSSAPGHRMDQLIAQNRPIIDFMKTMPRADLMKYAGVALAVESRPPTCGRTTLCSAAAGWPKW